MDKFGIFNLLNSFLSPSAPTPDQNNEQDSNSINPPSDFLNGILNSLKNGSAQKTDQPSQATPPTPPLKENKPTSPLQAQMLSTMHAHDELIRRINLTNPKK